MALRNPHFLGNAIGIRVVTGRHFIQHFAVGCLIGCVVRRRARGGLAKRRGRDRNGRPRRLGRRRLVAKCSAYSRSDRTDCFPAFRRRPPRWLRFGARGHLGQVRFLGIAIRIRVVSSGFPPSIPRKAPKLAACSNREYGRPAKGGVGGGDIGSLDTWGGVALSRIAARIHVWAGRMSPQHLAAGRPSSCAISLPWSHRGQLCSSGSVKGAPVQRSKMEISVVEPRKRVFSLRPFYWEPH